MIGDVGSRRRGEQSWSCQKGLGKWEFRTREKKDLIKAYTMSRENVHEKETSRKEWEKTGSENL